jgi:hypothetical protein
MILEMEGCEIVGMERRRAKGLEIGVLVLLLVLEPMGSLGNGVGGSVESSTSTALRAEYEYEYERRRRG